MRTHPVSHRGPDATSGQRLRRDPDVGPLGRVLHHVVQQVVQDLVHPLGVREDRGQQTGHRQLDHEGAAGGHPARAAGADARGAAPGRPVHEDALALTRAPAGQLVRSLEAPGWPPLCSSNSATTALTLLLQRGRQRPPSSCRSRRPAPDCGWSVVWFLAWPVSSKAGGRRSASPSTAASCVPWTRTWSATAASIGARSSTRPSWRGTRHVRTRR